METNKSKYILKLENEINNYDGGDISPVMDAIVDALMNNEKIYLPAIKVKKSEQKYYDKEWSEISVSYDEKDYYVLMTTGPNIEDEYSEIDVEADFYDALDDVVYKEGSSGVAIRTDEAEFAIVKYNILLLLHEVDRARRYNHE